MGWDYDDECYVCEKCGKKIEDGDGAVMIEDAVAEQDGYGDWNLSSQGVRETYHQECYTLSP